MTEKEIFEKAYINNEIPDFFKGSKGYMIYPEDAQRFIDSPPPGTGNLMFHAIKFGIIPYCKDYPQLNIGNKVANILNEMILSKDFSDFYSGVKATTAILENEFENELNISPAQFEKILIDMKNSIEKNKEYLQNTVNYFGNITFYEEFSRMNDTLENGKHIL